MRRLASLAAAALLLAPGAARAAGGSAVFGMRGVPNPKLGYFVYTLTPGATKQGAVLVTNNGTAAGTVRLYVADGTTGATTGTVYLTDKKPAHAGAWIGLDHSSLTLKPGAHQLVHFTVKVPSGAAAGQWVAGLVAETERVEQGQKTNRKASVQVRIRSQTILAVQVDVPGPTAARFHIGTVSAGGTHGFQQVLVGIANTGNALSKPTGTVTITNSKGTVVETIPLRMDTFLPQTRISYPVTLKKALAPGSYQTHVTLDYQGAAGHAQTVSATPTLTVSSQNVQQVFTSSSPTQAPPTTTSASPSTGSKSSVSTALIVAIAAGGIVLLALVWLVLQRSRRRPQPS
jgi:WxL Interacting Protein, peptidoglycan binding domain